MNISSAQLSPRNQRIYAVIRIVIALAFFGVAGLVADRILFPSAHFILDLTKPNALSNTLTLDAATDSHQTLLHAAVIGKYDRANISYIASSQSAHISPVTIRKSYQSTFLPIPIAQGSIPPNLLTPTTLAAGTLLTYGLGVGVIIDDTTISPINTATTLLALGYSFDHVRDSKSDNLSNYTKGKIFTIRSHHPDGTIFFFDDINKHYIIHNNQLLPLSPVEIASISPQRLATIITAQFASRDTAETCAPRQSLLPWQSNHFNCTTDITNLAQFAGANYAITNGLTTAELTEVTVTLTRARTIANATATIARIKQRLLANYE